MPIQSQICHWTCTKLTDVHDNYISECLNLHQQSTLSPVLQITPVTMQTVNRQYHSYWYFSAGRSTDIPPLEAGDYIQCPHFHALASQWQCSLHSWAVDRKILLCTWIKMPRTTQNYTIYYDQNATIVKGQLNDTKEHSQKRTSSQHIRIYRLYWLNIKLANVPLT